MTTAPVLKTVAELLGDRYNDDMKEAFPDVVPPYYPFGYNMLLQLRYAVDKTKGGVYLPDEYREGLEQFRTQAALVRALGPACFKNRDTMKPWKEGAWCAEGDFVRSPMYGGDRFWVDYKKPGTDNKIRVLFVFVKDADAVALVTGDPLTVQTS
jgi:hypothetical protein